jgi:hypothetical protein
MAVCILLPRLRMRIFLIPPGSMAVCTLKRLMLTCRLLRLRVRQLRRSLRRVETQSVLFEGAGESDALRSDMDHGLRTKSAPHHTSSP